MILLAPYWGLQIITLVAVASCTSSNRLTFVEHSFKIIEHQNYLIISIQKIITQKSKNTHKRKKKTTHFFVGVCCGCALSVCQGQAL
jgi:putative Ca2+/H+ antiporter (TMEM165/GDT1 family)